MHAVPCRAICQVFGVGLKARALGTSAELAVWRSTTVSLLVPSATRYAYRPPPELTAGLARVNSQPSTYNRLWRRVYRLVYCVSQPVGVRRMLVAR